MDGDPIDELVNK